MVVVLGARVDDVDMRQALQKVMDYINAYQKNKQKFQIITLNAEMIYLAQNDEEWMKIINDADLLTPDGAGVLWAAQRLGQPLKERVTGIDLMQAICDLASDGRIGIYLFGAAPGVAGLAADKLKLRYPDIRICGVKNGYFNDAETPQIVAEINEKKPDVLFVALGAPKQEKWIKANLAQIDCGVFIGVGGSFDVIAGNVKRAPVLFQKLRLEWFWRLLTNPSRIGRMMVLPKFMKAVKKSSQ